MKKLYKIKDEGKIYGVCAGIADKYNIDVTLLRILTFILCCCYGSGILIYLVLAFLLPDKNDID